MIKRLKQKCISALLDPLPFNFKRQCQFSNFWKIKKSLFEKKTLVWLIFPNCKVGCVFPMVIGSEFRMRQYRDDDHRDDALHFSNMGRLSCDRTKNTILNANPEFKTTLVGHLNNLNRNKNCISLRFSYSKTFQNFLKLFSIFQKLGNLWIFWYIMICWSATVNKWTILDGNWYESGRFRMIMNDFVGQCGRSSVGWLTVYETGRKHCLFSRTVHFQSLESSRFTPIYRPLWTWPFNRLLKLCVTPGDNFTFICSIFCWFSFLESRVKSRFGLYTSHHQAWNIVEPDSGGIQPKNFDFRFVRGDGSESSAIIFSQSESDIRNSFET